jgi:hypothetical protein
MALKRAEEAQYPAGFRSGADVSYSLLLRGESPSINLPPVAVFAKHLRVSELNASITERARQLSGKGLPISVGLARFRDTSAHRVGQSVHRLNPFTAGLLLLCLLQMGYIQSTYGPR